MNIKNRTIYCKDNLEILQGINSESVDMIYLDPPFNKKKSFIALKGKAAGAEFKDTWYADDIKDEWVLSIQEQYPKLYLYLFNVKDFAKASDYAYLVYMAVRVLECYRVLKSTGSLFYHCDDTMQHYIKLMVDIIFGRSNFRNEIKWRRSASHNDGNNFGRISEAILYYSKTSDFKFNNIYVEREDADKYFPYLEKETGRYYRRNVITGPGKQNTLVVNGIEMKSHPGRMYWSQEKFDKLLSEGRIKINEKNVPYRKVYKDEDKGLQISDLWVDIQTKTMTKKEKIGYPTQKPLALLRRIIECSTNPGYFVLDPFCGCATTAVACESFDDENRRQWAGIDISIKAYNLVVGRLSREVDLFSNAEFDWLREVGHFDEAPIRTDLDAIQDEFHTAGERRRRSLTKEVREAVWERDGGKCVECLAKENIHYDHIIPFSLGGSNTKDNLQILCASCNLSKGNRLHA